MPNVSPASMVPSYFSAGIFKLRLPTPPINCAAFKFKAGKFCQIWYLSLLIEHSRYDPAHAEISQEHGLLVPF